MNDLLDQSFEACRSLTSELSPAILFEAGLEAALLWLSRQMEINHGLVVQTALSAHVEHDQDGVAMLLYQAARELLFNVVKHSKVKAARVQLSRLDRGRVQITVSDEGVGFDPDRLHSAGMSGTGMGLFGIRERLEHLGGQLEIDSAPGNGTRISLTAAVGRPRKRT
jgi:signal transduction histidine kinase